MKFETIVTRTAIILGLFWGCQGPDLNASEVALAWDSPTNNINGSVLSDLAGYKLYCGTSSRSYSTVLDLGNTNACKVADLSQGLTYYFAVTVSLRNDVQSDYSTELVWSAPDTTPPLISAPAAVSVMAEANGLAAVPNLVQSVVVSDNCSPSAAILVTQAPAAGVLIGPGVTPVVLTATDQSGNSARVTVNVTAMAATLPAPWNARDISSGSLRAGGTSVSNGVFTLSGAGNISGSADNCRYVYQALSGDGEIRARVASLANAGANAKAGVMIRESLTGSSRHATVSLSPAGQLEFLVRTSTGGSVNSTVSPGNVAPNNWVRLTRKGSKITAMKSANGTAWTSIATKTVNMASAISVGLVTVSGDTNSLSTATIANVTVIP